MQCKHCETEIPDEAKFCLNCGKSQGNSYRNNGTITLLILLAAVFVSAMAYLIVRMDVERREKEARNGQSQPLTNSSALQSSQTLTPSSNDKQPVSPPPQPEPVVTPPKPPTSREQKLVRDFLTIEAGLFKWYEFKVAERATIHGRFEVSGGRSHDLRVIVTDQQGFMNLQNHKPFKQWFDSGSVKVGSINTQLPPGDYVLVLSNLHSVIADAKVSASIYVTQWSGASQ